ncbi:cytochrome P450 [Whalleya microplaca]|nr:cytochrome P450 [Whalleya microplaca]
MDLVSCVALTILQLIALQPVRKLDSLLILKSFLALFTLQYTLLKICRVVLYPNFFSPLRHLPGPKDHNLLLGQEIKKFRADSPVGAQLEWMHRWPDAPFIRYLSFAGKEALVVNNLAAHKAVLQTHVYDFVKPPFFSRLVGEITGVGLLFSEGEAHKRERRLLAGPFSIPSMRKLLPIFQMKARGLSDVFEGALGNKPYTSLEVVETFSKSTMETICMTVLGIEQDTLSSKYPLGFQELYSRVLHQGPLGQLISVINAFVPIRRIVPLEANYRFIQATADLRTMLREIIQQRAADLADGTFKREMGESRDLLTYMLEEAQLRRQESGIEVWATDDIIGHLLNFTSAGLTPEIHTQSTHLGLIDHFLGHESTATTMAWALYVLATNHHLQDRLRSEIQSLLETSPHPDYDEISNLPYLNNFIREVLRLYSPSLMSIRSTSRDLTIEGVAIPAGTQIDINMAIMHRHPSVWGASAPAFDPDRWDRLAGDAASPYAFQAFLQGPRMCPGRNFALVQVKTVLVALVRRWRFLGVERWGEGKGKGKGKGEGGELLSGGEEEVGRGVRLANPSLTYRPADGLLVRFERL